MKKIYFLIFVCLMMVANVFASPLGVTTTQSQTNVTCGGGTNGTATVVATGTPPYSYVWLGGAAASQTTATATGLSAGGYTVTTTDATSATAVNTFIITQPPALSVSGTSTFCPTNTVTLTGSMSGGTWSSGDAAVATVGSSSGVVTGAAAGITNITYVHSCGTATRTVTVGAFAGTIGGLQTVCATAFIAHTTTGAGGGAWVSSNTAVGTINPSTGTMGGVTPGGTTTVSYTVTNSCGTQTATVLNTVYQLTDPGSISGASSVCTGAMTTMTSSSTTISSPPYSHAWSSSATAIATVNAATGEVTGMAGGTSRITYTATGCGTFRTFFTMNVLPTSVSAITGTPTVATGSTTALSSTTNGGVWSSTNPGVGTVSSLGVVTGISAGVTTISYLINNSCGISVATVDVTVTSGALSATQSQTNVSCNGGTDGSATVSATGGTTPYTYAWMGGSAATQTTATATGLSAGSYTVTVTDAASGSVVKTFTITEPAALTVAAIGGTPTVVVGSTTALTDATGGGVWSSTNTAVGSISSTGVVTGISAGATVISYLVTNSCGSAVATVNVTVTAPALTVVPFTYSGSMVTWTVPAGITSIDIDAGGAQGGGDATNFVHSAGGRVQATMAVTPGQVLNIFIGGAGGDGSLSSSVPAAGGFNGGGTSGSYVSGPSHYHGGGGGGATDIRVGGTALGNRKLVAGAGGGSGYGAAPMNGGTGGEYGTFGYSDNGITGATGATPVAAGTGGSFSGQPSGSNGALGVGGNASTGNGIPGGGGAGYYGGGGGGTIGSGPGGGGGGGSSYADAALTAVSYTQGYNAGNGYVNITYGLPAPSITATMSSTGATCNGSCNGTATASAPTGGTAPYTYSWAPSGGTAATATGLCAGTYTVTITDAASVSGTETVTVTQPSAITSFVSSQTNVACNGGTGSATISASGGTGTLNYSWTPTGGAAATATGLTAGTYSVNITDANACARVQTVTITQPSVLTSSVSSTTNVSCNGGSNGSATVAVSGGTPTYSYSWAPSGGTAAAALGLAANTYSVTITDANSCVRVQTVTITQPSALTSSVSATTNTTCNGGSDGSATIAASGGTGAYNYSWAPSGGTAATATGLSAGNYSVTITDANACTRIQTVTVTQPAPLAAVTGTNLLCIGSTTALSTTNVGGAWSSSNTGVATINTSGFVTPLSAGTTTISYTVGGCASTMVVSVNALPTVAGITPSLTSLCTGTAVTFTAGAVTGTGALTSYNWTGPNGYSTTGTTNTASLTPTGTAASGIYSVTVTYPGNGCTSTTSVTPAVTVNITPSLTGVTNSGTTCAGTPISFSANGAANVLSYSWTGPVTLTGNTTATPGLAAPTTAASGTYTVAVSNGSGTGCTVNYTSAITVNALPTVAGITPSSTSICTGTTVTFTAGAVTGTGALTSYNWSGPNSFSTTGTTNTTSITPVNALPAGSYSLTVTYPGNGCTSTTVSSTPLVINTPPTLTSVTNSGTTCVGTTVNFSANGPANVTGYSWTGPVALTGNTTATPTVTPVSTAASGTYSVVVNNGSGTGCTATYTTAVTVNARPTVASITPSTTSVCTGTAVNFTAGAVTGTGALTSYNWSGPNSFNTTGTTNTASVTPATTAAAGIYSVTVTYPGNGCTSAVASTAAVTVNIAPTLTGATNSGACVGATLSLSANGAANVTGYAWTGPVAITGNTTATPTVPSATLGATGIYTVVVSNGSGTGCTATYTTAATVSPVPTLTSASNNGPVCNGATLALNANGAANVTGYAWSGPGSITNANTASASVVTAPSSATGIYTVVVNNGTGTGCTATYTTSATVYPVAVPYAVTGGGSYCSGGAGLTVSLANSSPSITYQLYNFATPIGSPVAGTSGPINFGIQTLSGTYTVVAFPGTACSTNMSGSATITINPLPTAYTVTGGGNYCAGTSGSAVGLSFGAAGIQYTLYNGATSVAVVNGANSALSFGNITTAGTYTVAALNTTTGCTANMSGSAVIGINAAPAAFAVTGGGSLCSGSAGVATGLAGSTSGVNYQLYNGASAVGTAVAGTGSAISFGLQTVAGAYSVVATNATTGCVANMTGSVTVIVNPTPAVFTVSGGGTYCSGGTGVTVGLNGSASGINYTLYNGSTSTGVSVAGTGSAISFGTFTASGTYTVLATNPSTSCTAGMVGSTAITINALPTAFAVTGGGAYCAGGTGMAIGLGNSQSGINYQLFIGASAVTTVPGTGSAISFGTFTTPGSYTVLAVNPATGCSISQTGSATITVNAIPVAFSVTGGGAYCAGGTGVAVGLGGSAAGVSYQLYNGATPVGTAVTGTGSPISFGLQTTGATYTVFATNTTTTCTNTMSGSATVAINPLPVAFAVTGGGSYCAGSAGVPVGLAVSATGVNYQLYNGAVAVGGPIPGTGSALSFGAMTTAGTYTVQATNTGTGCINNMSGSATVIMNAVPGTFPVTSSGSSYCAGSTGITLGLGGSATGINYQLYNGSTATGTAVAGTGSAVSFGIYTAAGTYSVLATNATTGCTTNMTGSATITVNALPTAFAVTGGGAYCAGGTGVAVGLGGSSAGISYQLYNGAATVGTAVAGTNAAISFGLQTAAGTYSVLATNTTTGCTASMTGSSIIAINALPVAQSVTGGGIYCAGGTGVTIGLGGSVSGVSYQLYNGSTAVATVTGTGSAVSFGLQTAAGTYTVLATATATGCTANMTGSATITINAAPVVYTLTGGGAYCAGGTGVNGVLNGSNTGIYYQLYNNGLPQGSPLPGTGGNITFANLTAAGSYSVIATNSSTSCTSNMTGTITVVINALPSVYAVTGGGGYCTGGTGVNVGLSNSATGITYQLYRNTVATGSPVAGTGFALDFGLKTTAGIYTVVAVNTATSCTSNMSGSASVVINPLPFTYSVTGGGSYCSGAAGVNIGLSNSEPTVSYQLYNGSGLTGTPVVGTGGAIDFGLFTATGVYTVLASNTSTGCTNNMSGNAVISVNPLPTVYNVTGGGPVCSGSGVNVNLNFSASGITYQLYNGATAVGSPVAGTGSAISFGLQSAAGTYSVLATNSTTSCQRAMAGSATIIVNALPVAYAVTGGGAYCAGGAGMAIGVGNTSTAVSYQLYNGATAVGSPVTGTGGAISFGLQTAAGTYSVIGTNTTTLCSNAMAGSATVTVNAVPFAYIVNGGGAYCAGGTGVSVTLSGSNTGISYQLMNGSVAVGAPVAGNGGTISFGLQTTAGSYGVIATNNTTTCSNTMIGSVAVSINTLPVAYTVTGGGSYCSGDGGVSVGLGNSASGISYQLYNGGTPVGAPVAGGGGAISFGMQTAGGNYSVLATNTTTGCTATMTSVVTVTVNPLPALFAMTGGGTLCAGSAGVAVGVAGSVTGTVYQLYNGTTAAGSAVLGTGGAISFGAMTAAGTYTVSATITATGCTRTMSGNATVIVNAVPAAQPVNGGGAYCAGGAGVTVSLGSSATGISYQLYNGSTATGSAVPGTGGAISFGMQTAAGTYSVLATNTTTGCTSGMTGTATVIMNALPTAYPVVGVGSSYCEGGTGIQILLNGSQAGITYQLLNGTSPVGASYAGTGGVLDFGSMIIPGIYSVLATDNTTGCTATMSGTAGVQVAPLPAAYAVSGGGSYCLDGSGVAVGVTGSASGISYQLYRNGVMTGAPVSGTGSAISFGMQTAEGSYMVMATNDATGCMNNMSGTVTVTINALPGSYTVNGGGSYCSGSDGVAIGLGGSSTGISYQLYNGSTMMGSAVSGTGGAISFGMQTAAGTYSVLATNTTTTCTSNMTGVATITITALPVSYAVTGSGNYCAGGAGLSIGLAGSTAGIIYQLYDGGGTVGAAVTGTGSALSFGVQPAGSYTVTATSTATGCSAVMTGVANVTASALPVSYNVTGGGNYCTASGTGVTVGLDNSAPGVNYQLYRDGTAVGGSVSGTGLAISFGSQALAGTYTVTGISAATSCSNNMTGTAVITVSTPVAPSVTVSTGVGNTVCLGLLTTFTATAVNGGTSPVYQWTVNGFPALSSTNTYSYVPNDGDIVAVAMTSSESCTLPATATASIVMTVSAHEMPQAVVSVMPNDTVCQGTTVTYSVTPVFGGMSPTYVWLKNGVQVATGTSYSYVPSNSDVITCKMTSDFPCRLQDEVSTAVTMTVDVPTIPVVSIGVNPGTTITAGTSVTMTANVTGVVRNPSYQWILNSDPVFGATNATYNSHSYANNDSVTVLVASNNACAPAYGYSSVVMRVGTTGVSAVAGAGDIRLMPNPNKGSFVVSGTTGTLDNTEVTIDVTDMLGQIVYRGKVMAAGGVINERIQLSNTLANGMYLLNLRTEAASKVIHFVVEQ